MSEKFTATKISKTFRDAPDWWNPADGSSKASVVWNMKRYGAFLESKGYRIVDSGIKTPSPWWMAEKVST